MGEFADRLHIEPTEHLSNINLGNFLPGRNSSDVETIVDAYVSAAHLLKARFDFKIHGCYVCCGEPFIGNGIFAVLK